MVRDHGMNWNLSSWVVYASQNSWIKQMSEVTHEDGFMPTCYKEILTFAEGYFHA